MNDIGTLAVGKPAAVIVIIMGLAWIVTLVRKVGPNEALIIYGLGTGGQPKVIKGGGTVVVPLLQSAKSCRWS